MLSENKLKQGKGIFRAALGPWKLLQSWFCYRKVVRSARNYSDCDREKTIPICQQTVLFKHCSNFHVLPLGRGAGLMEGVRSSSYHHPSKCAGWQAAAASQGSLHCPTTAGAMAGVAQAGQALVWISTTDIPLMGCCSPWHGAAGCFGPDPVCTWDKASLAMMPWNMLGKDLSLL